ncbi:MAG: DMT family transporter [Anaerolineae bacterium]|nr:DMT family transporter [Anaerolineae bacterium]
MDEIKGGAAKFSLLRRYPAQPLSQEQRRGMLNTMAASFFLGWAPILGKLAYRYGVNPFTLAALRTVVAALLLWSVFVLFWRREIKVSWSGLLGCVSVGIVNGFGSLLYYTSLARLDASLASLLNTLYPLWVALFLFASGQPLSSLTLIRLGLAMSGVFLLTWGVTGEVDWLGVTLMIASAATYGWHLVLGQWVMADVPARPGTLYILTAMACVVSLARVVQSPVNRVALEPIADPGWYAIIALGITTALSRLAMFSALRQVGGVETSIGGLLELVVSLVLAFVLLGERMTVWQWAGGALLVLSMLLMSKDPGLLLAQGNEPVEWKHEV